MKSDKKVQIIKAAQKRLAKHGLQKTTLDEIARDIRMGKATLYYYFQSKEDIFYAAADYEISQLIAEIAEISANNAINKEQKLLEYFLYKETALDKFPLLSQVYSFFLKDTANDKDSELIRKLLTEEAKIISDILNAGEKPKSDVDIDAAGLAAQSWGICLVKKIPPFSGIDMKSVYQLTAKI